MCLQFAVLLGGSSTLGALQDVVLMSGSAVVIFAIASPPEQLIVSEDATGTVVPVSALTKRPEQGQILSIAMSICPQWFVVFATKCFCSSKNFWRSHISERLFPLHSCLRSPCYSWLLRSILFYFFPFSTNPKPHTRLRWRKIT